MLSPHLGVGCNEPNDVARDISEQVIRIEDHCEIYQKLFEKC